MTIVVLLRIQILDHLRDITCHGILKSMAGKCTAEDRNLDFAAGATKKFTLDFDDALENEGNFIKQQK